MASDSPVSEASCTRSAVADRIRASAPTASPSEGTRTSARTSPADGTVVSRPSRSTVEAAAVIELRAATALSALGSCTRPMAAFARTIAPMTITSIGRPRAPSTTHATTEMTMATSSR